MSKWKRIDYHDFTTWPEAGKPCLILDARTKTLLYRETIRDGYDWDSSLIDDKSDDLWCLVLPDFPKPRGKRPTELQSKMEAAFFELKKEKVDVDGLTRAMVSITGAIAILAEGIYDQENTKDRKQGNTESRKQRSNEARQPVS